MIFGCSAFAQSDALYKSIYDKSPKNDFSSNREKELFARAVSDKDNEIPVTMIDTVTFQEQTDIKNYGQVDLIKVKLKNNPSVLSPCFLVIVNHAKKQLQAINLDDYKLIKSKATDKFKSIIALVDNRGSIDLQFYKYHLDKLKLYQTKNLTVITDCKRVEPNNIMIANKDINHDGWLDMSVVFKQVNYCDKDGNEHDKPISQDRIVKNIPFKPLLKNWK